MQFKSYGLSDVGLSRSNNEDVFIAMPEMGFFALADGMGGHVAGEIAAQETLEKLAQNIKSIPKKPPLAILVALREAIESANKWVFEQSQKVQTLNGMGTTLCCLLWSHDFVIYAHVGDSRIYRHRNQKLELLTQDHSLLTKWLKLKKHSHSPFPYKNIITKAVGTTPLANPEIAICSFQPGDLFLLCTDGLSDVLTLHDMEKVINHSKNLEFSAKLLIETAKIKGSSDNITILMIQTDEKYISRQQRNDPNRSEGAESYAFRSGRASSQSL